MRKKERKNESCFPASFLCCQVVLFVMMIMMMLLLLYIPARVVVFFFFFFFSCAAATLARAAICTRLFLQLLLAYGKRSLQCSILLCWLLLLVAVAKRTRICISSSPSSSSAVRLCSKSRIRCMCSEKQSSSSSSAVGMSVCLCYKSNTRDCEEMSIRSSSRHYYCYGRTKTSSTSGNKAAMILINLEQKTEFLLLLLPACVCVSYKWNIRYCERDINQNFCFASLLL